MSPHIQRERNNDMTSNPSWSIEDHNAGSREADKSQDDLTVDDIVEAFHRDVDTEPVDLPGANQQSLIGKPASGDIASQVESGDRSSRDCSSQPFWPGFSNEEDPDGEFDHTYRGKGKKSPRRSNDEDGMSALGGNSSIKRARKSIFGASGDGSFNVSDEKADDEETLPETTMSVGKRMSSLKLIQKNDGKMDSEARKKEAGVFIPFDSGLDFGIAPGRGGSPTPSTQSNGFIDRLEPDPDIGWNYDLRNNVSREPKTTQLDLDETANYDPAEEVKQKMLNLNKAKARKKKAQQKTVLKPNEKIRKLILRLSFRRIGTVVNIMDGEENWPSDWSEEDTEDERERKERAQNKRFRVQRSKGHKLQIPILDPKGELTDLTGHPIARGCVTCRISDQNCSMVKDGTWPCTQCNDNGNYCDPIISPKIKGKCMRCDELGEDVFCSYEEPGEEQGDRCEQCIDDGHQNCLAGPATGWRPERIDMNQILYGTERKWTACRHCRQHGKRCSLKEKTDRPPCKSCKRMKIVCTFYDVANRETRKNGKKKAVFPSTEKDNKSKHGTGMFTPTAASSDLFTPEDLADLLVEEENEVVREATPEIEMADADGRVGMVTKINTCFAHPINFDLLGDSSYCSFCEMPLFGMVGLFEKQVHVLRYNDGLGYGELAAGHRADDQPPTVLCSQCVISRVQINLCVSHVVQPIADSSATEDIDTAADALMEAKPGTIEYFDQLQRWCSMCFHIASFKCCNAQPSFCGDDEGLEGCGLRLCDSCEERLRELNGDSSVMAAELDKEPKWGEGVEERPEHSPRADVGFLVKDGHLMNNFSLKLPAGDEDGEGE